MAEELNYIAINLYLNSHMLLAATVFDKTAELPRKCLPGRGLLT